MNSNSYIEKLYSLEKIGIKLGLENTLKLANYLGNPQDKLKCVHIAGTNGKGSTSSFIASILQEKGYKIGLYTSPHLIKFNERIKINGNEINDNYIKEFIDNHFEYIYKNNFTFFEATTLLAFKYFADNNVDYAVIETGLGGRLDSTNIITPFGSVITNIAIDHHEYLGNTLEKIAYEKAGIIKENRPTFCGFLYPEAENVITSIAKEKYSNLFLLKDFVNIYENFFTFKQNEDTKYYNGLNGKYQVKNSALATLVVKNLFPEIDTQTIIQGLQNVKVNTNLNGRFEYYHKNPDVIFDCAHNPNGVDAFIESFKDIHNNYDKRILIFGAMKDKDIDNMLSIVEKYFDFIYFCDIDYERSATKEFLQNKFGNENKFSILNNVESFISEFINKESNNIIVFLGSIYILGKIKEGLQRCL